MIYMHRTILDAPDGTDVDHVDGNGLNNCRANIRLCTRAENVRNRRKSTHPKGVAPSSPFKGVSRYTARLWAANICVNYSHIALGTFATETDAALAYDAAARIHFGAFARVNFPRAGEQAA